MSTLRAAAGGDDDLAPADPVPVRVIGERQLPARRRGAEDRVEAHRLQPAGTRPLRGAVGEDGQRHPLAVDAEIEAAREDRRVAGLPHLRSLLEGRDLGQVEGVAHVDAVACEVDGGEVIDGEVAERVGRRGTREHGCAEDPEQRRRGR